EQRRMDRTEYGDAPGRGQEAGRPGLRFEGRAVEIGITAVALPAAYRQDEIDASPIGHPREAQAVRPTCGPAFRRSGGRAARGTVGPEHPDLERVRVVHAQALTHRSTRYWHLIVSRISGNGNQGPIIQHSRMLPRLMDSRAGLVNDCRPRMIQ